MKLLKRLKRKKGFTLTECLISMLIFALMASIVMQILAIAIAQYRSNDSIDKDMDTQISDLVQENALVERETTNLVMKFVSGTGGTNNITINDMKIENGSSDGADGRLQINKIDATINNDGGNKDKDKNNGGMVTDDIHIYGTKDADSIYAEEKSAVLTGDTYQIQFDFKISTEKGVLNGSESKSIKIALPSSAKNIVVTPDDKMIYSMVSGTNVRFSAKSKDNKDTSYVMHIVFTLGAEEFEKEYKSFAKYFIDPASELEDKSKTFDDKATPGIYNHPTGTPIKEDNP